MIKCLLLSSVMLLCACAPGQFLDRHAGGLPESSNANFEYIGCHVVYGEKYAMAPFGFKVKATANMIWFKQKNADGTSATLAATSCWQHLYARK